MHHPNTIEQDTHLPRWAYAVLAVTTAIIGLTCSAITAEFFIIGLERTESDSLAREALIAAGVLMIVVELAAFGLSALLPRQKLRGLRVQLMLIGLLLVGFEGVTIYVTQYLLVRGAEAHSQGETSQIQNQAARLAGQREAIALLRAKAGRESASPYAWIRETSTATLREAAALETSADTEARALAQLQAARRPTLTDALGESGVLAYSVARALLISVMGLVMFGASGALLRASRPTGVMAATVTATPPVAEPAPTQGFAHGRQVTPAGAPVSVPPYLRRWAAAGVPIATIPAAFAAPTVTVEAPAATVTVPTATAPTVTIDTATPEDTVTIQTVTLGTATEPTVTIEAPAMTETVPTATVEAMTETTPTVTKRTPSARTVTASTATTATTATTRVRYERIRAGITAGTLRPSVRAVQAAEGGGTAEVRACLRQLEHEGVLRRTAKGYALAAPQHDPRQMNLTGDAA